MKRIIILTTFVLIAFTVSAQTINDVINAFNAGAEQVNSGNFETAITKFEECIQLAIQVGEQGNEMKAKAEGQLPALYYRIASDKYKAKDIEGAITWFEKTVEICTLYGNEDTKTKSLNYIPQLYYAKGNAHFKNEENDKALESYDKAIEYTPDYAKAYYGKGLVYKKLGDEANMMSMLEKAIETGKSTADDKTVEGATKTARDFIVTEGAKAMKAEDYDAAIARFNASMKYDDKFADPYYFLAVIYNKKLEYQKAVDYAEKAVFYDTSEPERKARIYFELGNAYLGIVEYEKACVAFTNALYEPYTNTVKYKMENVLKCQ